VRAGPRIVRLRAEFPTRDAQAMKRFRVQGDCATGMLDPPRADVAIPQLVGRLGPRADSPDEFAATRGCCA
jgi:hypothetical protein